MTTMSTDETVAGIAPEAETQIVEPVDYPETPTAWSQEGPTELIERRTWPEAWGRATVIAAISVGIAVVVAAVVVLATRGGTSSTPAAPAATMPAAALPPIQSAPVEPPAATAPVAAPPEVDEWVAGAISQLAVTRYANGDAGASVAGLFKAPTQRGAIKGAMQLCAKYTGNTDCGLLNQGVYHGCVAYMTDRKTASYAAGSGNNERAAIMSATVALGAPDPIGDSYCSDHAGEGR